MNDEALKALFVGMYRIRQIEEAIAERYGEQEMRCPVHLSIGQEAVAVGVCASLEAGDLASSAHRSHAHYLAKGGDLKAMLAELYGKVTGCCRGNGGSMHLIDRAVGFLGAVPIVGSTIPIGVGAAFGTSLQKKKTVSAVFFGEGATEEGVLHESLNFAALRRLPVVFICENNGYSVYSPLSVRQPANREVISLAQGHGIESVQGDGNDVVEVRQLTLAAVQKARSGGGPTFLEFKTYRWREHCGPNYDNQLAYRSEAEFESWKSRDPIQRLKRDMVDRRALSQSDLAEIAARITAEVEEAFAFAKSSPFPDASLLTQHVYAP